jgi:branched-subunit amino acid ABC-type transport system permease component
MIWKLGLILFAIGGISHIIFGIVYVTASEFMPYHAQALNVDWNSLGENYKILFLALIRLAGVGGLVAGLVNLTLISYLYHRVESRLIWLLLASSLIFQSMTNYVVYSVYMNTPGDPPLLMVSIGSATFFIATILLLAGSRGQHA